MLKVFGNDAFYVNFAISSKHSCKGKIMGEIMNEDYSKQLQLISPRPQQDLMPGPGSIICKISFTLFRDLIHDTKLSTNIHGHVNRNEYHVLSGYE